MKKYVYLLLLFVIACQTGKEKSEKVDVAQPTEIEQVAPIIFDLDSIQKRGVLRVILNNSPISYFVYKGHPMGFQYELAARFAKDLNLDIEVVLAENIEHAIDLLVAGKGDLLATGLTANAERRKSVGFTDRIYSTHQCLIQRKPENWRKMNKHTLNSRMLRDVLDLEKDTVYVKYASSYKNRLSNLSEEIGEKIYVIEAPDSLLALDLMDQVAEGKIKYTVADDNLAKLGEIFHDNIDYETPISFAQQVAWAVRQDDEKLMEAANNWIEVCKESGIRNIIYNKYFGNTRSVEKRMESPYNFIKEGELSPYDDLIKKYANEIGWDWRLLAAQIYKESNFNPKARSWVGAKGLMQLMPRTAASYGVHNPTNPERGIYGGTRHIVWLEDLFQERIEDPVERQKFILGAYNVGQGHVFDAQRLAEKYGKDPQKWDDVAYYLLKKSSPKYYNDKVVKYGYCRGIEVVTYVDRIYEVYALYEDLFEA